MNMADPFSTADIDAKLREITDAIRAHDELIKAYTADRDALAEHFQRLSQARDTLAREMEAISKLTIPGLPPAGSVLAALGSNIPSPGPADDEGSPTLKSKIFQIVSDWRDPDGASASEVTKALSAQGEGTHVLPRVFYSMVYLNLMRLTETGELKFKKLERGRRFFAAKKEQP